MGYQVAWIDILPTTHLRIALDRILASGWPASRLVYPLTWMTLQSTLILGTGIFLFGQQGPKGK
jgi:hypothetical protein